MRNSQKKMSNSAHVTTECRGKHWQHKGRKVQPKGAGTPEFYFGIKQNNKCLISLWMLSNMARMRVKTMTCSVPTTPASLSEVRKAGFINSFEVESRFRG